MKINCIIIDDEPLAIRVIEKHILNINEIEIIAKCENAVDAFQIIQKEKIDLIFLDIQMPELTGIEFLKTLSYPPKVIITTAYREYALEGYELDVVDYLLKPISFYRFLKAIGKVYARSGYDFSENLPSIKSKNLQDEFLFVKVKKKLVKIFLKEILYIEKQRDYIYIKTTEKEIHTKKLISDMSETLPDEQFIRIHRSFIIAIEKVEAISPNTIVIDKFEIPIGRSYRELVLKKFNYKNFMK